MRILFENLGHAERYLRVCIDVLRHGMAGAHRFPTLKTQNSFCLAFGYSSYNELRSLAGRSHFQEPKSSDMFNALEKGFSLAIPIAEERGFKPTSPYPNKAYDLAILAYEKTHVSEKADCGPFIFENPNFESRLFSQYRQLTGSWSEEKRLLVLAAMLGWNSWPEFVASCKPNGPHFVYDEYLPSDKQRQERWLAMARRAAIAAGIELPDAVELVARVHPTLGLNESPERKKLKYYYPNETFDAAFVEDPGLWKAGVSWEGHAFVPPGLKLSRASNFAAFHRRIHDDFRRPRRDEHIWALTPKGFRSETGGVDQYFRRGQIMEIAPIPPDFILTPSKKKNARPLKEFAEEEFPSLDDAAHQELIEKWLSDYETLKHAAGIDRQIRLKEGSWIEITTAARKRIRKPWYWPVVPVDPKSKSVAEALEVVKKAEAEVIEFYGVLPEHYIATH